MKYVFIINPIAGNDNKAKILNRIKSTFRLIDDEMIVEETKERGDAKVISKKYADEFGDQCVIVSCGGDGTVHEIANGLAGSDTPLLILPLGTGNDFAKKIYDSKKINVENVIKSFGFYDGKLKYDVKPIDLIDYNGEKCINIMSFGIDVLVETLGRKLASKASFLGHNAYNLAVIPAVLKPLHYYINYDITCFNKETGEKYNITADNKDYCLFAICNASYYGGGYCPAPNAVLDDGLLEYVILNGTTLPKVAPLIPKYSKGVLTTKDTPLLEQGYMLGGKIWSVDGGSLLGECDGENFDYSEVEFKVEQKALKLCFIKE